MSCNTWLNEYPDISDLAEENEVDIRYIVNTLAVTKSTLLSRRATIELIDINQDYFSKLHGIFKSNKTIKDKDFDNKLTSLLILAPDLKYVCSDLKLLSVRRIIKTLVSEPFTDMFTHIIDPERFIQMVDLMFSDVISIFLSEFIDIAVPILLSYHDIKYHECFRRTILPLLIMEHTSLSDDVKVDANETHVFKMVYDNRADKQIVKHIRKSKAKHEARIN